MKKREQISPLVGQTRTFFVKEVTDFAGEFVREEYPHT
jgi:hypothetical protein